MRHLAYSGTPPASRTHATGQIAGTEVATLLHYIKILIITKTETKRKYQIADARYVSNRNLWITLMCILKPTCGWALQCSLVFFSIYDITKYCISLTKSKFPPEPPTLRSNQASSRFLQTDLPPRSPSTNRAKIKRINDVTYPTARSASSIPSHPLHAILTDWLLGARGPSSRRPLRTSAHFCSCIPIGTVPTLLGPHIRRRDSL